MTTENTQNRGVATDSALAASWESFDSAWDAGYERAMVEHETGVRCSMESSPDTDFGDSIDAEMDFRNGMTAYRDDHDLCDADFDLPNVMNEPRGNQA